MHLDTCCIYKLTLQVTKYRNTDCISTFYLDVVGVFDKDPFLFGQIIITSFSLGWVLLEKNTEILSIRGVSDSVKTNQVFWSVFILLVDKSFLADRIPSISFFGGTFLGTTHSSNKLIHHTDHLMKTLHLSHNVRTSFCLLQHFNLQRWLSLTLRCCHF